MTIRTPKGLSSLVIPPGTMTQDNAQARGRERIDAARKVGWPLGCTVIADTREQHPWKFPIVESGTLKTGDYSVAGLEDVAVIERKSLSDAWSSCGSGRGSKFATSRARFRREFERMADMKMACVIVEGSMGQLATQPERSMVDPATVIGTYRSWWVKYGVPCWFADNRAMAQRFAGLLLVDFWKMFRNNIKGDK